MPPPNLIDLGVAEDTFHFGRERRHTYWTLPTFRALIIEENLPYDKKKRAVLENLDLSSVGAFGTFDSAEFYDDFDPNALDEFIDTFNKSQSTAPKKKQGRPRKQLTKTKEGDATETPKRGRAPKRKAEEALGEGEGPSEATPKRRVRSKKAATEAEESGPPAPPKKRGRPSKASLAAAAAEAELNPTISATPPPKKRARVAPKPRKSAIPATPATETSPKESATVDEAHEENPPRLSSVEQDGTSNALSSLDHHDRGLVVNVAMDKEGATPFVSSAEQVNTPTTAVEPISPTVQVCDAFPPACPLGGLTVL